MITKAKEYGYDDVCQFYRDEAVKRKAAEDATK
jgi:hypothetical protein